MHSTAVTRRFKPAPKQLHSQHQSKKEEPSMSEQTQNYSYAPAETNLEARLRATKAEHDKASSVVIHWGIQSRQNKLQALLNDQRENLHSLLFNNLCTCGLQLEDDGMTTILDLVLSKHHRNPVTLEQDLDPRFRGMVSRRLFSMGGPNPIDEKWNNFVLNYLGKEIRNRVFVPIVWQPLRDIRHTVWHPRPVSPKEEF
jgi:hypothetical protein